MLRVLPVAITLTAVLVPSAAAAKPIQPGRYEGVDAAGAVVSVVVDAKRRISGLSVPAIDCGNGRIARIGILFNGRAGDGGLFAPLPIKKGAFARSATTDFASARVSGRVAGRTLLRGTMRTTVGSACAYTSTFTARRLQRVAPDPASGAWTGTDALGNTVSFSPWATSATSRVDAVHVAGPWDGCGRLPEHRGVHPILAGGADRSRATNRYTFGTRLAGPLRLAIDAGRVLGLAPQRPDGTSVETTFEGTATGRTATGHWRLVIRDRQGAALCDSGPVSWQAAPRG